MFLYRKPTITKVIRAHEKRLKAIDDKLFLTHTALARKAVKDERANVEGVVTVSVI